MTSARSRSFGPTTIPGVFTNNSGSSYSTTGLLHKLCDDVVGGGKIDKPFNLVRREYDPCLINGQVGQPGGRNYRVFSNVHTYYPGDPVAAGLLYPSLGAGQSESASATEAIASTNPSRAHVSLPVFGVEMRELPHLVKQTGSFLNKWHRAARSNKLGDLKKSLSPKELANANLALQFGWKPLISDLKKLLDFQGAFDKRMDELNRLSQGQGLKRSHSEGTKTSSYYDDSIALQTYLELIRAHENRESSVRRWSSVRWKPSNAILGKSNQDLRRIATRHFYGLDKSQLIQNVWNLIPWSWLVDWFAGVDDLLGASNNSLAHSPKVCVMTHSQETRTYSVYYIKFDRVSCSDGRLQLEHKQRYVAGSSVSASLPILSGRQLSILGSLAITKSGIRF